MHVLMGAILVFDRVERRMEGESGWSLAVARLFWLLAIRFVRSFPSFTRLSFSFSLSLNSFLCFAAIVCPIFRISPSGKVMD